MTPPLTLSSSPTLRPFSVLETRESEESPFVLAFPFFRLEKPRLMSDVSTPFALACCRSRPQRPPSTPSELVSTPTESSPSSLTSELTTTLSSLVRLRSAFVFGSEWRADWLHLCADPLYLGWKRTRVRGKLYDNFIDKFINNCKDLFVRRHPLYFLSVTLRI